MKSIKVNKANELSSVVIKAARTELVFFFNYALRKTKGIKKKSKNTVF